MKGIFFEALDRTGRVRAQNPSENNTWCYVSKRSQFPGRFCGKESLIGEMWCGEG
jgi:hypothetical protein